MTEPIAEASPRSHARIAGLFYLLTFLTGAAAVPSFRLVVDGNAAATANNILAHPSLFRWGFAALLINVVVYIAVTQLFYHLFKPVNRSLSLCAAFAWLTFLWPPLAGSLSPYNLAAGVLGEGSLTL